MATTASPNQQPAAGTTVSPITSLQPSQQRPPAHRPLASTMTPSTASLPQPSPVSPLEETYDPTSTDPFSPFYCHARASESKSRTNLPTSYSHSRTQSHSRGHPDLEKGPTVLMHPVASKSAYSVAAKDGCEKTQGMKQSLLCKSEAKKSKGLRGCWRKMSKRQRVLVHMCIALLFVGAVTGLGIGVSKAMGTGVWKSSNRASQGIGEES